VRRSYGNFDSLIESSINLNTGFFGVYPKFDLKKEINEILEKKQFFWNDHLDEQGLLSYIFFKKKFELITLDQIYVCHKDFEYKKGKYGQHFVQLNRGFTKYWELFIKQKIEEEYKHA